MIGNLDLLARFFPSLLAGLIVCLLPAVLHAQTVVFRNECKAPVVVQTTTVVNGVLLRDSPWLLRSMQATPKIALRVNKIVTIYDAKSNHILFRDVLRATPKELAFGIVVDKRVVGKVQVLTRRPETVTPGKPNAGKMSPGKMSER